MFLLLGDDNQDSSVAFMSPDDETGTIPPNLNFENY